MSTIITQNLDDLTLKTRRISIPIKKRVYNGCISPYTWLGVTPDLIALNEPEVEVQFVKSTFVLLCLQYGILYFSMNYARSFIYCWAMVMGYSRHFPRLCFLSFRRNAIQPRDIYTKSSSGSHGHTTGGLLYQETITDFPNIFGSLVCSCYRRRCKFMSMA
ncbi:hypothetical protein BC829DRAFT_247736 [Chytridium lagenaria]|nr:hypothetical protein BC829DRAFT_247736 [Chytridium lagenaria]